MISKPPRIIINAAMIWFCGWLISWPLIAGMANAHFRSEFPNMPEMHTAHNAREDLGSSIAWAGFAALVWPIFLPGCFSVWGFGQDGWTLSAKATP